MISTRAYLTLAVIAVLMTMGAERQLKFNPPKLSDAPEQIRDAVKRGYNIINETHKYAPDHVGNKLDCTNCHFNAGLDKDAISLVGVGAVYPKYNPVQKKVIDLATSTNMCFQQNLNAKPLPVDSEDMIALLTYYQWISKETPIYAHVPWLGLKPIKSRHKSNVKAGSHVFSRCMFCHGADGQGRPSNGALPLWGEGGFSSGSAMSAEPMLAAFVHRFMPEGSADLTETQAIDVAGFVLSHPRPKMK